MLKYYWIDEIIQELLHYPSRRVQTNQKDGVVEVIIPFSQHQAPLFSGVFCL
tara:strand:+ start:162 stop:317 length:156 start_codon:yes stop_codon:yes gene_type:complete